MKSLANVFGDLVYHFQPHDNTPRSWRDLHDYEWWARHPNQHPDIIQVAQKPSQYHGQARAHTAPSQAEQTPSELEIRDYLTSLAKAYDLPVDFVHSVAQTESSFNPKKEHRNPGYVTKNGRHVPATIDYGLMQINSSKIGHDLAKDPNGNRFKVGEDVKHDWKANARAGVAILAEQYEVAKIEQGPVTSDQDRAQQAYSGYNGGSGNRDRYVHETRDGLPRDKNDRHFLENYRAERTKR